MHSSSSDLAAFAGRLHRLRVGFARAIDLPELTAAEFAKMLTIAVPDYLAYESGAREPPLSVLATLHRRTGVSLDWLVAEDGADDRPAPGLRPGDGASPPPV